MRVSERKGEMVVAWVLFFIGLLWILVARTMPYGEFSVPGPGFLPTLLGALLCGVSLALGISLLLQKTTERVKIGHSYIWAITAALFLVAFFFERIGFILTITLFLSFSLKMLSNLKWIACILWAAAGAIVAFLFFNTLLGIQLPSLYWF